MRETSFDVTQSTRYFNFEEISPIDTKRLEIVSYARIPGRIVYSAYRKSLEPLPRKEGMNRVAGRVHNVHGALKRGPRHKVDVHF